jgi:hypothetical protein
MNRDLVINVLLIVAGVLLAFLLFGAGALWRSKSRPKTSHAVTSSQIVSEESSVVPPEYGFC